MRVPRICVYWLLLFSLLGIDSCTGGGVHKKTIPTNCDATAKNCAVRIDADCSAPDTTYSVQFLKAKTPFQPSTGKVTVVLAGSPSKPVTGDNSCGTPPNLPPSANNTGCYFYYDVFHGNKECSDPGIHVVN